MNRDHRLSVLRRLKQYHPAVPNTPSVDDHHISVEFFNTRQERLDAELTLDADTLAFLTYSEVVAYNPEVEEKIATYDGIIPTSIDILNPESVTVQLEERPLNYYYEDYTLTDDFIDNTQLYVNPQDWTGVFGLQPSGGTRRNTLLVQSHLPQSRYRNHDICTV